MKIDPHPLRTPMIRPADELYRVDVSEQTQERLRVRSERVSPTMRTTVGRREWRWGKPVDPPSSTSTPLIMGPSDLEAGRQPESPTHGTIADVVKRLQKR